MSRRKKPLSIDWKAAENHLGNCAAVAQQAMTLLVAAMLHVAHKDKDKASQAAYEALQRVKFLVAALEAKEDGSGSTEAVAASAVPADSAEASGGAEQAVQDSTAPTE